MRGRCVNTKDEANPGTDSTQSTMATKTSATHEAAVDRAWELFCRLHDAPSCIHADQLVHWLGEDPRHVRAFDEALTMWALAGAALLGPVLEEAQHNGSDLQ
jgi:ferric-dicitrate binding protein FerR (iron transport regulator)